MSKALLIMGSICAIFLIAFAFVAGCTSQAGGDSPAQATVPAATPQVTETPASTDQGSSASADASGAFIDDSQSAPTPGDQSQVTMAPDQTVVAGSGAAGTNLTTDSVDLGDITP